MMASSTPNDDWFQSAAAAQIRSERFERAELLNGRVAMLGFAAALIGEWITGYGPAGQVMALLRWYLSWSADSNWFALLGLS